MDRGEGWIGAFIAGWFCFLYAGLATLAIVLIAAIPVGLIVACLRSNVEPLGTRMVWAYPWTVAGMAVLAGLVGILGGR